MLSSAFSSKLAETKFAKLTEFFRHFIYLKVDFHKFAGCQKKIRPHMANTYFAMYVLGLIFANFGHFYLAQKNKCHKCIIAN